MTPAEARAELIRRLESGDYTQGPSALKAVHEDTGETRHCCLGVGAEIAVEAGLCKWAPFTGTPETAEGQALRDDGWVLMELVTLTPGRYSDAHYDVLSRAAQELLGFRTSDGRYGDLSDLGTHRSLAIDNDAGVPFAEIAQKIAEEKSLL